MFVECFLKKIKENIRHKTYEAATVVTIWRALPVKIDMVNGDRRAKDSTACETALSRKAYVQ